MTGPGRGGLRLRRGPAAAARPAAEPHRHRQAAGRPAGSPSTRSVWTATCRSTEAPRRRGAGGLRLRPGGRRLLDRRAGPRAAAGPVRREPAHDRAGPAQRRPRRAVAGRDGAVRGHRLAHPVRQLRPLLGRPRPGQAVRRARRHRRLPAGAARPARSVPATRSRSSPAPTTGSPWRRRSGSRPPSSPGCPSSRRRCRTCR